MGISANLQLRCSLVQRWNDWIFEVRSQRSRSWQDQIRSKKHVGILNFMHSTIRIANNLPAKAYTGWQFAIEYHLVLWMQPTRDCYVPVSCSLPAGKVAHRWFRCILSLRCARRWCSAEAKGSSGVRYVSLLCQEPWLGVASYELLELSESLHWRDRVHRLY